MEFGYKLRQLRNAKGYGLREFAKVVKKSPSYLSNIERGVVPPPSAEVVKQIAEELDGNLEELLELAKRFDMDSFEKIRKNAGRLEIAERTIKFLTSAINLEDNDPLGGISGIIETVTGERILNPAEKFMGNSVTTIKFVMELASKPDEGNNRLGIQLRREIAQGVFKLMGDTAHPYSNYDTEEKPGLLEMFMEIFKKYPRELCEEVIKRDDLRTAYYATLK